MAQSIQERLQSQLGAMIVELHVKDIKIEELQEENAKLKAQLPEVPATE